MTTPPSASRFLLLLVAWTGVGEAARTSHHAQQAIRVGGGNLELETNTSTTGSQWRSLKGVVVFTRGETNKPEYKYLSTSFFGYANMYHKNDGSGRMVFDFELVRTAKFKYDDTEMNKLYASTVAEMQDGVGSGYQEVGVYYIKLNGWYLSMGAGKKGATDVLTRSRDFGGGSQLWYAIKRNDEAAKGHTSYMFANAWQYRNPYNSEPNEYLECAGETAPWFLALTRSNFVGAASQQRCFGGNGGRNCMWYLLNPQDAAIRDESAEVGLELNPSAMSAVEGFDVQGQWVAIMRQVAVTGQYKYAVGSKATNGTMKELSWASKIEAAVSAGFKIGGVGVGTKVSGSLGQEIAHSHRHELSSEEDSTLKITLTKEDQDTALWQWHFSITGPDGIQVTTKSNEYCWTRRFDQPPPCLPGHHTTVKYAETCTDGKYEIDM